MTTTEAINIVAKLLKRYERVLTDSNTDESEILTQVKAVKILYDLVIEGQQACTDVSTS